MSKLSVNTEMDVMDRSSSHKSQNPLHWFGVLVPQSLRWCQHNFIHATELILALSTAKARLTHALYHFRLVQCEKAVILHSDASELFLGISMLEDCTNTSHSIDEQSSLSDDVEVLSSDSLQQSDNLLCT